MYRDLTKGKISSTLILFALPMIGGNLLQQFYNIADTLIVGRVIGRNALAAVGSAYTLMTFLTSVFLGLSMGSGALFSIYYGQNRKDRLRLAILHSLVLIMAVTLLVNILVFVFLDPILTFMRVPDKVRPDMKIYLEIIFRDLSPHPYTTTAHVCYAHSATRWHLLYSSEYRQWSISDLTCFLSPYSGWVSKALRPQL